MKSLKMAAAVLAAVAGLCVPGEVRVRAQEGEMHHEHFVKCAKACADCQVACDSCFQHCADLVAKGKKEHVKTMHSCIDCAEFCTLAGRLSARGSSYAATACMACAKTCDECATACEKFKDDRHMSDCAKSCRNCARECRSMIEHLKH